MNLHARSDESLVKLIGFFYGFRCLLSFFLLKKFSLEFRKHCVIFEFVHHNFVFFLYHHTFLLFRLTYPSRYVLNQTYLCLFNWIFLFTLNLISYSFRLFLLFLLYNLVYFIIIFPLLSMLLLLLFLLISKYSFYYLL